MNIGMLGIGRMGRAIGERLLDQGHRLTVWNRSPGKTEPLVALGARAAASPAEVVGASELVLSLLTDAAAIATVYDGPGGALSGQAGGKLFVEMSTVRPQTEIALAQRVRERGAALIECPVGGTVGPARDGKLLGLVGGDPADVARARPVLEQMCRRVEHVGPIGAGASMKLAINLPLLVYWEALAEALTIARSAGLDPVRLMDIMADTSGAPSILKLRGSAIASALAGTNLGPAHFNIDTIRKDLRTMIEEARSLGASLPAAQATLSAFDAASAAGLGDRDGAELAAWRLAQQQQRS